MDVLNFFCPNCGRKTTIKKEFSPMGKKKKCKGCDHIFPLSSDTMRIRVVKTNSLLNSSPQLGPSKQPDLNPFNSTQIKAPTTRKASPSSTIKPTERRVRDFNSTQIKPLVPETESKVRRESQKLDSTMFGKKIVIQCPHCDKQYRIRVYRDLDRYACTTTGKIFTLDDVRSMKIVGAQESKNTKDAQLVTDSGTAAKTAVDFNVQNEINKMQSGVVNEQTMTDLNLQDTSRNEVTSAMQSKLKEAIAKEMTVDLANLPRDEEVDREDKKKLTEKQVVIADKYQILGEIGAGGFGKVYMAFDKTLHRYVAIKLGVGLSPEEANTLSKLNHKNIVQLYDFGNYEGKLYIVMEYIQGMNICQYINKMKVHKRSEAEVSFKICQLFSDLCEVLAYLHNKGVYHADIKPENILVSTSGTIKLIDFGETKNFTYKYAAPERFENKPPSVKSDIYSLGGVMYEILTGKVPNQGSRLVELIYNAALQKQFPENSPVDRRLQNICLQCLSPEEQRYDNVDQLRLDLMNYVADRQKVSSVPHLYINSCKIMVPLTREKNYIGRALTNDIILDDDGISRIHCVIYISGNKISVENVSKNFAITVGEQRLSAGQKTNITQKTYLIMGKYRFTFVPKQLQKNVLQTNEQSYTIQQSLDEKPIALKDDDFSDFFRETGMGWEITGDGFSTE
ncbi:FHA domain-containing serine/threonine-protein kinase [Candidatus Uabimicrobium amorphum]|uniref:Putative serine/threonine-protein kinase PknB n=1 Tax=Uabimicrobium amorphum TaxID=2596890 RepID=A0A5S9IP17_UABAM|nr:FHA domain-containing serine/threonine-protein kinase [Candidatus Uabimicrobium amorphum]BBM85071.1 putative serine/threonine-protein kinase PknB [Candidatus Uabimicrobium amorphum]